MPTEILGLPTAYVDGDPLETADVLAAWLNVELARYGHVALNAAGTGPLTPDPNTQANRKVLVLTGLLTGNRTLVLPLDAGQEWLVINDTTGAFTVTAIGATGTGVLITQGYAGRVVADGTNVIRGGPQFSATALLVTTLLAATLGPTAAQQHTVPAVASDTLALLAAAQTLTNKTLTAPTINGGSWTGGTDLAVADGGTGASDAAGAQTNLQVPPTSRLVSAGTGMQGGGSLAADRTLALSAQAQKDLGSKPGVAAAAEAADARQVTIQLKEYAADLTTEARLVRVWLGDADLGAECATAPDVGVVIDVGTVLQTITAGKHWLIVSNASGVIQLTLTESTVKTFYVMAAEDGRIGSAAVAFT